MSHEPKLTVYTIKIKPINDKIENSNRWLFRNIIGQANAMELVDSYIITELFSKFITSLDQPEMYSDPITRKCMTANQNNIESNYVNANIILHSDKCIFEGKIEGGTYGKRRNKTSTVDKTIKSNVSEKDAITHDFYFLLFMPLESNKMILMLESYSDDSIDSVMKKFWKNFFRCENQFNIPEVRRFVPKGIIDSFKNNATVSSLTFSTEMPGETLLESATTIIDKNYKVTVHITPTDDNGIPMDEFEKTVYPIQETYFNRKLKFADFLRKKGVLKDKTTNKTTPFDLGTSFDIKPSIMLSRYITINNDETDFDRIKEYCFLLLEEIKQETYIRHAVKER